MATNAQDYWRFLTVGQAANPPETGRAATTHQGVKLPEWAVSMSRPQAAARGYRIDPHGYDPRSWFQDANERWFYAGDPSMKMQGGRAVDVQNAIEFRVRGQGEGGRISPPGGWNEPSLADLEAPSQTGPPSGPEEFGPVPEVSPQAAYEPQPGATPSELPSPGVEQVANQFQEPFQNQAPPFVEPTSGGDFPGFPGPTPSELPSPFETPTYEPQYAYPSGAGENIPTNEAMIPTGPGGGENIPTNEAMLPTGPEYAGENIPTDESMIPEGPSEFTATPEYQYDEEFQAAVPEADWVPPEGGVAPAVEEPAPTYSYPDGTGGYTTLDASGNAVEEPGLANIPGITFNAEGTGPSDVGNGQLYYDPVTKSWVQRAASTVAGVPGAVAKGIAGIPGSIANAARGIGRGIRSAIETPGWSSPEYLESQGYREGAGTDSLWPGAGPTVGGRDIGAFGAGGEGGSFFHANPHQGGGRFSPLAGTPGIFGRGASAASEQVPFWQRMLMRSAHQYRGNRPYIGGGDAVARFAARMGPPPPRHQGLYSPAARAAAISNMAAAAGGGAQQAPGGGMDVGPGQARGPGGRAMSPV